MKRALRHSKYQLFAQAQKLLSVYCTGHKEPVRHYFDAEEEQLRQRIKAHFPTSAMA